MDHRPARPRARARTLAATAAALLIAVALPSTRPYTPATAANDDATASPAHAGSTVSSARISPRAPRPDSGTPQAARSRFDLIAAQTLPDMPLRDLYITLRAKAVEGDVEAARYLFLALNQCRTALQQRPPMDTTYATVDPELLANAGQTREVFLAEQEHRRLLATDRTLENCQSLPAGALAETAGWLVFAAEAGDIYAQLAYGSYLELITGDEQEQRSSPEQVRQFKETTLRYLQNIANQGVPDGLYSLGRAYENGFFVGKDPVLAYAYMKAAGELSTLTDNAAVLEVMARGMTPAELAKANEQAASVVAGTRY